MASSHGTKVTTDPETLNNPKNENPGVVTSDSLAAESIQEGGSFAANSDSRGPSDQPSYSTTANNTDTSNATRLDPAPDAEARLASEAWDETAQLNAGSRLGKSAGIGPTYNTPSGGDQGGFNDVTNQQDYGSGNAAPAPGYVAASGDFNAQPKGKNLQEGGFDSDAPNASFTTDIGGKKDPGRVGLQNIEDNNAPFAGGAGPRESQITDDGQYDNLKDASA